MHKVSTQIDLTKMTPEEVINWALRVEEENREFRRLEALRLEEEGLKERIAQTPNFYSTRNTLVLRRTPDHELIAPARDVFAYLGIYKLRHPKDGKGTRVSDKEIEAYRQLMDEGTKESDITLKMIDERVSPESKGQPAASTVVEKDFTVIEEQDPTGTEEEDSNKGDDQD